MTKIIRRLRQCGILLLVTALPSVIGCPVLPAGNHWGQMDESCLDVWSVGHFATGAALGAGLGRDSFWASTGLLVAWEFIEPGLYPGESHTNQVCDVGIGELGWLAAGVCGP